jgi:TolB-like protein/Flp pilus assembly protein TadD
VLGAWLLLQIGDVIVEPAGLPGWSMTALLYVLILGFPLALFLGWRYEITEHGLVRSRPISAAEADELDLSLRPRDYVIFAALVIITGAVLYRLIPSISTEHRQAVEAERIAREAKPGSIAVLPFADISQGADQGYLGDGLADTVTHVLSQVDGLTVTARTSSFAFKDKNLNISTIADELSVANILEGSVQKAGDRVRIIARLIETDGGTELWSGNFDRELAGIFAIQDEIAREVVVALQDVLAGKDTDITESYRPDLAAYEQVILGRNKWAKRTSASLEAATAHFRKAIEIDPNYALAYVYLAQMTDRTERTERRGLIDKALDLDPLLGEAHAALAADQTAEKEYDAAEQSLLRAVELNPSDVDTRLTYSHWHFLQGRKEEALVQARLAAELDPQSNDAQVVLANVLWSLSRSEEAMAVIRDNIERAPEVPSNYDLLIRWLIQLGRAGEAAYYTQALYRLDPDNRDNQNMLCGIHYQFWEIEAGLACNRAYMERHPDDTEARKWYAGYTGDYETAIRLSAADVEATPNWIYRRVQLAHWLSYDGQWGRALEELEPVLPGLFAELPVLDDWNVWPARIVAQAWIETGQRERADVLLEAILDTLDRMRKLQGSGWTTGVDDVLVYALQGERDKALTHLERAIDSGWCFFSYDVSRDPNLNAMRDDPDLIALWDKLATRMAREREWFEQHKDDPLF